MFDIEQEVDLSDFGKKQQDSKDELSKSSAVVIDETYDADEMPARRKVIYIVIIVVFSLGALYLLYNSFFTTSTFDGPVPVNLGLPNGVPVPTNVQR